MIPQLKDFIIYFQRLWPREVEHREDRDEDTCDHRKTSEPHVDILPGASINSPQVASFSGFWTNKRQPLVLVKSKNTYFSNE